MIKTISPIELKKSLEKEEVLLIDVREPSEHKNICIDGACLIPLGQMSLEKIPSQSKKIVIHCAAGRRSAQACEKLLAENPELDIYSLEGGIHAWSQLGLPVKKHESGMISIERQTHILMGILILLGMSASFFVHRGFLVIPFLVGLGLINSGLTGWCGMSIFLTKMPWNR